MKLGHGVIYIVSSQSSSAFTLLIERERLSGISRGLMTGIEVLTAE